MATTNALRAFESIRKMAGCVYVLSDQQLNELTVRPWSEQLVGDYMTALTEGKRIYDAAVTHECDLGCEERCDVWDSPAFDLPVAVLGGVATTFEDSQCQADADGVTFDLGDMATFGGFELAASWLVGGGSTDERSDIAILEAVARLSALGLANEEIEELAKKCGNAISVAGAWEVILECVGGAYLYPFTRSDRTELLSLSAAIVAAWQRWAGHLKIEMGTAHLKEYARALEVFTASSHPQLHPAYNDHEQDGGEDS